MSTGNKKLKNSFKLLYKNFVFHLSANNSFFYLGFYRYLYKPRKGSLAEFADFYSRKKSPVKVVQVGSNDGFNHDPIHKFIKRDKWQGILLEPQKEVFENYLKKLHAKSEGINTINAALHYQDGTSPIYQISFSNARWATGLSSLDRPAMEKAADSDYVKACARNEGIDLPATIGERIKEEKISSISPETLLSKYHIQEIDWLQIDTEGFDFNIIKMFNIAKTRPKVIVFEQYQLSETERLECFKHLKDHSYRIKEYGRDALAILEPAAEFELFL